MITLQFRSGDGQTHLFQTHLVGTIKSVCMTDTDESVTSPPRLIDTVSDIPDLSYFKNNITGIVF